MKKNNISTAVLMPTYGRPDAVKDTLSACLGLYKKYNFDVYVFDSNGNNHTQDIVLELQKQHDNLYYIRLCEFIHLDCKWLDMIRGKYLKKEYDYLYPCGDANSLTEHSLSRIVPHLEQNVDIVNILDFSMINKTTEYNDPNEFFHSPNMNTGQWAGALYNKKSIFDLSDEEWNIAIAKWFTCNTEYIGLNGFILERISLCKNLKVIEPSMDGAKPHIVMRRSKYKSGSFWRKDAINLLGVTYPKVYRMLPECYDNVKKNITQLFKENFNEDFFWYLKQNSQFNFKDYLKYKKIFENEGIEILNKKILLMSLLPARKFFYKLIKKF